MIWVGEGCLSLGGGQFVHNGANVPPGALSPDQEEELVRAGWLIEGKPPGKRRRSRKKKVGDE